MKITVSGFGAERKKVAFLAALVLIAGYFFFSSRSGGETASAPAASRRPSKAALSPKSLSAPALAEDRVRARPRQDGQGHGLQEYRPSLKRKKDDPTAGVAIDPTLRLDLLAKLRNVPNEGGERSLFEFSQAPVKKEAPQIAFSRPIGPMPAPGAQGGPPIEKPATPPPPPIPLKFYGFVSPAERIGNKHAFFLDGEEIVIAGEGDLVKRRYKIVRIGVNSAVVEDTEHKNQQTLPLVQEQEG